TVNLGIGTHSLFARATDDLGQTNTGATVSVPVTQCNPPPTVNLTQPTTSPTYLLGDTIPLQASASDDGSIASVEFHAINPSGSDQRLQTVTSGSGGVYSASASSSGWAAGTYKFYAKATDNLGATTSSSQFSLALAASSGITVGYANATPSASLGPVKLG